jgi:3-oxoacyl-[acyl-carrier-protein] synthase-1
LPTCCWWPTPAASRHEAAGRHGAHPGQRARPGPRGHAGGAAAGPQRAARIDFETAALGTWLGLVDGLDELDWPAGLAAFDCRNNRLAELGLRSDGFADAVQQACARFGAGRVGVFLGTSTSGILQTELAYRRRDPATGALPADLHYAQTHNTYSVARYVRQRLGLQGPAAVVSTACSSSAKVFAAGGAPDREGLIDAAVVGGVDSLCMTTLYGFSALELVSADICRPWDAGRAACRSARPRPLRCWNVMLPHRRPGCWAAARAATATT